MTSRFLMCYGTQNGRRRHRRSRHQRPQRREKRKTHGQIEGFSFGAVGRQRRLLIAQFETRKQQKALVDARRGVCVRVFGQLNNTVFTIDGMLWTE